MHEVDTKSPIDARLGEGSRDNYPPQLDEDRLAQRIGTAVRHSTCGGIRELDVKIVRAQVVLQGRCGTYYCKQLAQHAAMDLIEALMLDMSVSNEIAVW